MTQRCAIECHVLITKTVSSWLCLGLGNWNNRNDLTNSFNMDVLNRYGKCFFKYQRTLLRLAGHDFFLPNFKPGLLGFFMYFVLAMFLFSNLYTIFCYDLFNRLSAIGFLCLALEVSVLWNKIKRNSFLKGTVCSLLLKFSQSNMAST